MICSALNTANAKTASINRYAEFVRQDHSEIILCKIRETWYQKSSLMSFRCSILFAVFPPFSKIASSLLNCYFQMTKITNQYYLFRIEKFQILQKIVCITILNRCNFL